MRWPWRSTDRESAGGGKTELVTFADDMVDGRRYGLTDRQIEGEIRQDWSVKRKGIGERTDYGMRMAVQGLFFFFNR